MEVAGHRVQRIADLLVAADPIEEKFLDSVLDGRGGVEANQPHTALHQLVQLLHLFGLRRLTRWNSQPSHIRTIVAAASSSAGSFGQVSR